MPIASGKREVRTGQDGRWLRMPAALMSLYLCRKCHLKLPAAVFNLAVSEFEERTVVTQECRVFLARRFFLGLGIVTFSNEKLAREGWTSNYLGDHQAQQRNWLK